MTRLVVAGIGTEVGKTVAAAMLVEALKADYWKPIQSGELHNSDTMKVKSLVNNPSSVFHPEAYRLNEPLSPHAAARLDGIDIRTAEIRIPETAQSLVVELAGGIMVPLNNTELNLDLLKAWKLPVVLISRNYLGSINHTLLSVAALRQHNIHIAGLIFNGETNAASEELILSYTQLKCLARIPALPDLNKEEIKKLAASVVL